MLKGAKIRANSYSVYFAYLVDAKGGINPCKFLFSV